MACKAARAQQKYPSFLNPFLHNSCIRFSHIHIRTSDSRIIANSTELCNVFNRLSNTKETSEDYHLIHDISEDANRVSSYYIQNTRLDEYYYSKFISLRIAWIAHLLIDERLQRWRSTSSTRSADSTWLPS